MKRIRKRDAALLGMLILVACGYTIGILWRRAQAGESFPSFDIYHAQYVSYIYALRSLSLGYGLHWNPFQNCGQPFIPATLVGLYDPFNLLFLVFDLDTGLFVSSCVHLAIAGIGTYLLAREYGVSRWAACCGALAFELSGSALSIAIWLPTTILGIYSWIPWAMLFCERILRAPSTGNSVALGVIFSLQLLPGYPQILVFTYQMVFARLIWELLTNKTSRRFSVIAALGCAGIIPVGLAAVQLFPSIELVRNSIRSSALTWDEISPAKMPWKTFRGLLGTGDIPYGSTFTIVPLVLAALSFANRATRRLAALYAIVAILTFALVFENVVLKLYLALPLGRTFRQPQRYIWLTSFAMAMLTAFGAEWLSPGRAGGNIRWRRALLLAPIACVVGAWLLTPAGLAWWEWTLGALSLLACGSALSRPRQAVLAQAALAVLLAINLIAVASHPFMGLVKDGNVVYAKREAFALLKSRMTGQERMFQVVKQFGDLSIQPKSGMLWGIPSIQDYEPQTARRYAALFVRLMWNAPMQTINQYIFQMRLLPENRPLLNFLGTRYLVGDLSGQDLPHLGLPRFKLIYRSDAGEHRQRWEGRILEIYENPAALPRTFFVPRAIVVPNAEDVLVELASPTHDPRKAALIETPPSDGFLGSDPRATGQVRIVEDHSEDLTIQVNATAAGFLSLTDQYYPGWSAEVNGFPTPILRANYIFRLVHVPAGVSTVVFRYRPRSVLWGVIVSCVSLLALVIYGVARSRPRRFKSSLEPVLGQVEHLENGNTARQEAAGRHAL